jgi:hypothetical protein
MPSASYRHWRTSRASALHDIETALAAVGGVGRGRRVAHQQVTRAYAVLLSAEFQGFCRDLHTECVESIKAAVPAALQPVIEREFAFNRLLDRGNPTPGNIGSDFNRLGVEFWPKVLAADLRAATWQRKLELLNSWRNAIAHNDYDRTKLGGTIVLRTAAVREWRRACTRLARLFDVVLPGHLHTVTGTLPWS